MKGRFITFEGIEGSGKSTVAKAFHEALGGAGHRVLLAREPGGTELSEAIRDLLLDPARSDVTPETELLLYLASRAQLVRQVIVPALVEGVNVICDRFMDASVAYQGWARGLGEDLVERLNAFAVGGAVPDVTYLLDLPVDEGFRRGPEHREGEGVRRKDRLEREDRFFHERVREGYLRLAGREHERFAVVDASLPFDEVVARIIRNFEERFDVSIP
ncbi:MAG TPA: dTMP kinase [Patescibacteria group bacterium]|nr:dTMP kinase [Patescibacteria group bacterium]